MPRTWPFSHPREINGQMTRDSYKPRRWRCSAFTVSYKLPGPRSLPPSRRVTINVLFARARPPRERKREGEGGAERKGKKPGEITAGDENAMNARKAARGYLEHDIASPKMTSLYGISDSRENYV